MTMERRRRRKEEMPVKPTGKLAIPTQCKALEIYTTGEEQCKKDAYGDYCGIHAEDRD